MHVEYYPGVSQEWRDRMAAEVLGNTAPDPSLAERIAALERENAALRQEQADLRHSMGALFVQMGVGEHED